MQALKHSNPDESAEISIKEPISFFRARVIPLALNVHNRDDAEYQYLGLSVSIDDINFSDLNLGLNLFNNSLKVTNSDLNIWFDIVDNQAEDLVRIRNKMYKDALAYLLNTGAQTPEDRELISYVQSVIDAMQ